MITKLKVLKRVFRVANKDSGSEACISWDDNEVPAPIQMLRGLLTECCGSATYVSNEVNEASGSA
jgi:hypothetical protein